MRPESRFALGHVLEAAREIQLATEGRSFSDYEADKRLRAVVERYFITIGEGLSRLARHDSELFARIPGGRGVVAFRNVLVHGYDVVDSEQVWAAVKDDLENLVSSVSELLAG
jgi:uncharacterized protein with HEPN domain